MFMYLWTLVKSITCNPYGVFFLVYYLQFVFFSAAYSTIYLIMCIIGRA